LDLTLIPTQRLAIHQELPSLSALNSLPRGESAVGGRVFLFGPRL